MNIDFNLERALDMAKIFIHKKRKKTSEKAKEQSAIIEVEQSKMYSK